MQADLRADLLGGSAALKVALVGPTEAEGGPLATHTVALARQLTNAGHDVTLVSWLRRGVDDIPGTVPWTIRSLSRTRPDSWARTGHHLRGYDTVILMHAGAATVPLHLALLHAAGVGVGGAARAGRPRGVLVVDDLVPDRDRAGLPGARGLLRSVLARVDGVVVHRAEQGPLAAQLGAGRVYAVRRPDSPDSPESAESAESRETARVVVSAREVLSSAVSGRDRLAGRRRGATDRWGGDGLDVDGEMSAAWAAYIGAIEALAAPWVPAVEPTEQLAPESAWALRDRLTLVCGRVAQARRSAAVLVDSRRRVHLTPVDLPDWVLATDVLDDATQADDARAEASRLGLRRCRDGIAAWAALGALAAIIRVADDGHRTAVVVDESGSRSPLSGWARAVGFAPVDLGVTASTSVPRGVDLLELDAGVVDVVVRIHPGGCDASDLDETMSQAAWALRPGGLLVLTVPLGAPGTALALGPADVRAVVARAGEQAFVLVGDLDGEVGRRIRRAATDAGASTLWTPGAAYGLVRLTLRRR